MGVVAFCVFSRVFFYSQFWFCFCYLVMALQTGSCATWSINCHTHQTPVIKATCIAFHAPPSPTRTQFTLASVSHGRRLWTGNGDAAGSRARHGRRHGSGHGARDAAGEHKRSTQYSSVGFFRRNFFTHTTSYMQNDGMQQQRQRQRKSSCFDMEFSGLASIHP